MTNEKGETFFVGKDVAKALGYRNPQKAIRDHVEEDKTVNKSFSVNGTRVIFINESGLYSLILSSQLAQAKAFKRLNPYNRTNRTSEKKTHEGSLSLFIYLLIL